MIQQQKRAVITTVVRYKRVTDHLFTNHGIDDLLVAVFYDVPLLVEKYDLSVTGFRFITCDALGKKDQCREIMSIINEYGHDPVTCEVMLRGKNRILNGITYLVSKYTPSLSQYPDCIPFGATVSVEDYVDLIWFLEDRWTHWGWEDV